MCDQLIAASADMCSGQSGVHGTVNNSHTVWACAYGHVVWACGMGMWYGHVVWACGMGMWYGHVVWACGMGMWYGHVVWACGMGMWYGHVVWACAYICVVYHKKKQDERCLKNHAVPEVQS